MKATDEGLEERSGCVHAAFVRQGFSSHWMYTLLPLYGLTDRHVILPRFPIACRTAEKT